MKILITGGSSGIGDAIARELSSKHTVTIIDKNEPQSNQLDFYKVDFLGEEEVYNFLEQTKISIDALINVAGMREIVAPDSLSLACWEAIFKINVTTPFILSQYAIKQALAEKKPLSIINIASVSGILAEPNRAAYVASKHALVGLTKQLAFQYGKDGIRVNAIAPGIIETSMTEAYFSDPDMVALIKNNTPVGFWGQSQHLLSLVDVCLFNQYMTGAVLVCDGGWSCGKNL